MKSIKPLDVSKLNPGLGLYDTGNTYAWEPVEWFDRFMRFLRRTPRAVYHSADFPVFPKGIGALEGSVFYATPEALENFPKEFLGQMYLKMTDRWGFIWAGVNANVTTQQILSVAEKYGRRYDRVINDFSKVEWVGQPEPRADKAFASGDYFYVVQGVEA